MSELISYLTPCTLIYPYYDSPQMLALQVENWNSYPDALRNCLHLIVIDDGSPNHPALPIFKECTLSKSLYRIRQNIPWNQHGARNLGAHVVEGEDTWLFMSDIDFITPPDVMIQLLSKRLDPTRYYTFRSVMLPTMAVGKRPWNMFLITRGLFWEAGGYDEDYCGSYGGDTPFFHHLNALAKQVNLSDIRLQWVETDLVPDASTDHWDRDTYHKLFLERWESKRTSGNTQPLNPLRFEWERQL